MIAQKLRANFWLTAMDAVTILGGHGGLLYLWMLGRAAACVDWKGRSHGR